MLKLRCARNGAFLGIVGILLAAALLRGIGLTQPWNGRDFHSAFAARGSGLMARNFAVNGFGELGFMPVLWRLQQGDGTIKRMWYTHHPVLFNLICGLSVSLFGRHAWALHLPSFIISLLSVVACFKLARELFDWQTGIVACGFFAVLPMGAFYGILPWTEIPIVWVHCLLLRQVAIWFKCSSRRAALLALIDIMACGLLDWEGLFILPPLVIHLCLWCWSRRDWRRLRALPLVALAALIPIVLHWLHLQLVLPPGAAGRSTASTLEFVTHLGVGLSQFLELQGFYMVRYYSLPGTYLLALAFLLQVLAACARRLEVTLLLVMPWPGILYVALFPGRSANHDFFLYLLLPWAAISLAWILRLLAAPRGPLRHARRMLVRLGVMLLLAWCTYLSVQLWRAGASQRMERLRHEPWAAQLIADTHTVVLTTRGDWELMSFWSAGTVIAEVDSVDKLESRRHLMSLLAPQMRVLFVFHLPYLLKDPLGTMIPLHRHLRKISSEQIHLNLKDGLGLGVFDLTRWAHQ